MLEGGSLAIAQSVDRSRPARRQLNLTSGLQLQQQAASGHILEPPSPIAPVPSLAQLTREPRPIRIGMAFQPIANQRHILGADRPPLNDQLSVHWPITTAKGKVSPGINQKKFLPSRAAFLVGGQNQLNACPLLPSSAP